MRTTLKATEAAPFKSLSKAYLERGPDDEYQVKKKDGEEYKPAAKSALKKPASYADQQRKKRDAAANRAEKEAHEKAALEAAIEQAKSIKITEDPALAEAVLINITKVDPGSLDSFERAATSQRKESCACAFKDVFSLWPSKVILSSSHYAEDSFVNRVPEDADSNTLLNIRHLALRCDKPRAIVFVRDVLESAFRTAYRELDFKKVSPPALVQTQVEGGATLFTLN
jgi:tRNA synthetases class II (D, K and N)